MKTVYTITPSWLVKKKKYFVDGVRNLEKLGFKIVNKKIIARLPSTRGKIKQIHKAFSNRNVEMILAQRGGYSSMKLLPFLDFGLIQRNPKIFAGFSDLSVLLNVLHEKTGLVTLHSPMVVNFAKPSRLMVRSFQNAVGGFPERNLFRGVPLRVYRSGTVRGLLKGGNLVTLTALIGTEWEIETEGSILFFEEVDEKLHKVDRNLTQWILAGKMNKIKGLILGDFQGLRNRDVGKIVTEQMKIHFPIVHCPFIGHGRNKITLPVGAAVELNTSRRSLTLL